MADAEIEQLRTDLDEKQREIDRLRVLQGNQAQLQMELEQLTPMRKELSELREDVHARTRREAELRGEIQTLSEAGNSGVSAGATARTVVITRERKLPKFSGRPATDSDPEVAEWMREIRQHVAELPESQKIDTIVGNLTGDARDEVQLLEEGEKGTAVTRLVHSMEPG